MDQRFTTSFPFYSSAEMLICSFSPIQNRFFSRIIPSLHRSMPPSHTTTSAVGSSWSSWRGRWGMTVRRPWQRTGLAKIQRGLKGKRWTDNLVVWPTAASGSCTEMITQSSHLTSLPARPQGTASTDMGQSVCVCVCGLRDMVWSFVVRCHHCYIKLTL